MSLMSMIMEAVSPTPDTDYVSAMNRYEKMEEKDFIRQYGLLVKADPRDDPKNMQPVHQVAAESMISAYLEHQEFLANNSATGRADRLLQALESDIDNSFNAPDMYSDAAIAETVARLNATEADINVGLDDDDLVIAIEGFGDAFKKIPFVALIASRLNKNKGAHVNASKQAPVYTLGDLQKMTPEQIATLYAGNLSAAGIHVFRFDENAFVDGSSAITISVIEADPDATYKIVHAPKGDVLYSTSGTGKNMKRRLACWANIAKYGNTCIDDDYDKFVKMVANDYLAGRATARL